jgi:hypothetical protein
MHQPKKKNLRIFSVISVFSSEHFLFASGGNLFNCRDFSTTHSLRSLEITEHTEEIQKFCVFFGQGQGWGYLYIEMVDSFLFAAEEEVDRAAEEGVKGGAEVAFERFFVDLGL